MISWLKRKEDQQFKMVENLGFHVETIENEEQLKNRIEELREGEDCHTFFISTKLAKQNDRVLDLYRKDEDITIIIPPEGKK